MLEPDARETVMLHSTGIGLIALLLFGLGPRPVRADAPAPPLPAGRSAWRRTPFVIGAPGRLDADGDVRHPRLYRRVDSLVAAYADVEEVQDRRWLRQEIEGYARRAVDCAGLERTWCRREVERVGAAPVIHLAAGAHAELVWLSGGNRAVRLGWRRIVDTRTGTMTLEAPPADFAAALLAEYPSQLEALGFDPAHDRAWAEGEVDRLLYYLEQVVAGLPTVVAEYPKRHALRFVEDGLGQIRRLYELQLGLTDPVAPGEALVASPAPGVLPMRLAEQLAAVRAWRAAPPWCAAQLASSAPSLAAGWQP
jgi:hypothetical protein